MVLDDFSRNYLTNLCIKNKSQQAKINIKASNLVTKLEESPSLEVQNQISLLNYQKLRHDTIDSSISHLTLTHSQHSFKLVAFAIPTMCDFCLLTVWGVANKGVVCKECGFNAHVKCREKVGGCSVQRNAGYDTSLEIKTQSGAADTTFEVTHESIEEPIRVEKGVIIYDHIASDENTGGYNEISVLQGDIVNILRMNDGDGWSLVSLKEKAGLVPRSYLRPLSGLGFN